LISFGLVLLNNLCFLLNKLNLTLHYFHTVIVIGLSWGGFIMRILNLLCFILWTMTQNN